MKFTNIVAAMTLFATSFTQATDLPVGSTGSTEVEQLLQQIQALQTTMNAKIDTLDTRVKTLQGWQGATLRKLPMWGKEDDEVNFEWPTE